MQVHELPALISAYVDFFIASIKQTLIYYQVHFINSLKMGFSFSPVFMVNQPGGKQLWSKRSHY